MRWYKEFDVDMPQKLKYICENFTKSNPPEEPWTYGSVQDSDCWCIPPLGPNRERLYAPEVENLASIRKLVSEITRLNLEFETSFMSVWRFNDAHPKCPVHTDPGGEHTGSVVTCISGDLKLHLHETNKAGAAIIDSVDVSPSKLIALNNTEFPHSVSGYGDIIVFGVDKQLDAEEYFRDV
jgi:hypothetical protein